MRPAAEPNEPPGCSHVLAQRYHIGGGARPRVGAYKNVSAVKAEIVDGTVPTRPGSPRGPCEHCAWEVKHEPGA